jgi:hypothetical protein
MTLSTAHGSACGTGAEAGEAMTAVEVKSIDPATRTPIIPRLRTLFLLPQGKESPLEKAVTINPFRSCMPPLRTKIF